MCFLGTTTTATATTATTATTTAGMDSAFGLRLFIFCYFF
jgi:hypothetical protein